MKVCGAQRVIADRLVYWCCALSLILLHSCPVSAGGRFISASQRAKLTTLDLVVDQPLLDKIAPRLVLSEEQRFVLQRTFDEYWMRIVEINKDAHARALNDGLRELNEEIAAERWREDAERFKFDAKAFDAAQYDRHLALHALRVRYMRHLYAARKLADAELAKWIASLREVGIVDERTEPSVMRLIRRENFDFGGSWSDSDFEKVPDLITLIEAASGPGGEMEAMRGEMAFEEALAAIVLTYEIRVDDWVLDQIAEARKPLRENEPPPVINSIDHPEEFAAAREKLCKLWNDRFRPSKAGMDAIAALLEENLSDRWRTRFYTALAPELMADRAPDRMMMWLKDRNDCTAGQIEAANLISAQWFAKRERMRREIIQAALAAKREADVLWSTVNATPELCKYATLMYQLHEAGVETGRKFEAILTPAQHPAFTEAFRQLEIRVSDPAFGPPMNPSLLELLPLSRDSISSIR